MQSSAMAECRSEYQKLPPGWDCKYDQSTGKCYYINYFTKAMQLEDPRKRYKQLQNEKCSTESIVMQPMHGSPYHVYPASIYPAVKAFQGPNPSLHNVSASPLLSTKTQIQMEMSPVLRPPSPQMTRVGSLSRRQTVQETSFTNQIDTDAVVTKINNMFPTASDNHIRLLLKKYYNREAVVISALQVEKHPVTMPGPFATPPAQRHLFHSNSAFQMTPPARRFEPMISRTGSPIPGRPGSVASGLYGSPCIGEQFRSSPKPHSSPKMKLRYLKNVFPKADETLLLDILANSDNNVQKASEKLLTMGYIKRDVLTAPKLSNRAAEEKRWDTANAADKIIPLHPKVLTAEEKNEIKQNLQARYKTIAERIILMALESVNYSEDRASQILQIVLQEDESKAKKQAAENGESSKSDAGLVHEEPEVANESVRSDSQIAAATPQTTTTLAFESSQLSPSSPSTQPRAQRYESRATTTTSLVLSSVENADGYTSNYNYDSVPIPVFDSSCTSSSAQPPLPSFSSSSSSSDSSTIPHTDAIKKLKKSRSKAKSDFMKNTPKGTPENAVDASAKSEFQSILARIGSKGPNTELCKGPNDELLLADYITWSGANPDISIGRKGLAQGADATLLSDRNNYSTRGHNAELCKGPQVGLAKGSIYSQINRAIATNVKCN